MCILQRNSQLGNAELKQHMYLYKIVIICEGPYVFMQMQLATLLKYCTVRVVHKTSIVIIGRF